MTERKSLESERAELAALADLIDNANGVEVCTFDPMRLEHKRTHLSGDDIARLGGGLAALRRLAAQDQKPVAWLQSSGTKTIVSQQRLDMDASRYGWTEKQLYLSPPLRKVEATLSKPAPVAANASAEAITEADIRAHVGDGMVSMQNVIDAANAILATRASAEARLREALEEARLQIEYMHGKFEPTGSGNAVISRIIEVLYGHPHASDCDKQGER